MAHDIFGAQTRQNSGFCAGVLLGELESEAP